MVRRLHSRATPALVSLVALLLLAGSAWAQGPTGTLTGRVVDGDERPIAGVTVRLASPSMPGTQQVETSDNGDYAFLHLPPGRYEVSFEAALFAPAQRTRMVAATEPVAVNITMVPAEVTETVDVVEDTGVFAHTIESGTSFRGDLLTALPAGRTIGSALGLAPGVHQTGPDNAVTIGGSMSFDNVFQVDGVQIQDNVRGNPLGLYIEDAILETTVLTSGVPAEYGRFAGGVINAITKSGGNDFSGSFRTSFSNDNWRSVTPMDESKANRTLPTYEYTLGGSLVEDHTWFFVAGRTSDRTESRQTGYTNLPYDYRNDQKRLEVKVTQAFRATQRLSVAYTGVRETEYNNAHPNPAGIMDLASLTTRDLPQNLMAVKYAGTFGSRLFLEAQYSARTLAFEGDGGLFTDLVRGTTMMDQSTGAYYWAPNFCGVCGREERNNTDVAVKGTYLLSSGGAGSHLMTFGYDGYNDQTLADMYQSSSNYHVWTTGTTIENGQVYPVVEPGVSTFIIWWPLAETSQGTNFRTHSFFVNDRWALGDWSMNLGVRYDRNAGRDASNALVVNDSALSPRLGVAYDVGGSGRTTVHASAGRYVTGMANGIANQGSRAGLPAIYGHFYEGPAINTDGGPLVPTEDALVTIFDWYNAVQPEPFFVDVPGVASRIDGTLRSPHADEFTVGVTQQLGRRGVVRADIVSRRFGGFYAARIDTTTGQVFDEVGQPYDMKVVENTDRLERDYLALDLQGRYRLGSRLQLGGSYTLSELTGNVNGESASAGPTAAGILSYPEYFDAAWRFPMGDLSADQRHRLRLWALYDLFEGRAGDLSIGAIQQMESGTPYGASGSVLVSAFVDNPGYALAPDLMSYFFTGRDAFRTDTMTRTDLSVNYGFRLGAAAGPELFAEFQLLNIFNQFQAFNIGAINTSVLTAIDDDSRFEFFDPFTEAPIQGVHWDYGDQFGEPVNADAFTSPRSFRFSVGFRF